MSVISNLYIVDVKIFVTNLGMWVVSVNANDLHVIWWLDLKTSVLFADFLVKIGIFSKP